jgi:hypothetical protein
MHLQSLCPHFFEVVKWLAGVCFSGLVVVLLSLCLEAVLWRIRSDRCCRLVKGVYLCFVALQAAVCFGRLDILGGWPW